MTYNLSDLEKIFEKTNEKVEEFEKNHYYQRISTLYLANGDVIRYYVPTKSIPHLLGIKTNYYQSTGLNKATDSFSLLKEIIENPYRINKNNKILDQSILFSEYIIKKIDAFFTNIEIDLRKTILVCKHDPIEKYKEEAKKLGLNIEKENEGKENEDEKPQYIILKEYDGKYYLLIIASEKNTGYYVPKSNRVYDSYAEMEKALKPLIEKQEVTLLNGIINTNSHSTYRKRSNLYIHEKEEKAKRIEEWKKIFKYYVDILHDYIYSLSESDKHLNKQSSKRNLIDTLAEYIKKGKIIDYSGFDYSELQVIVEAFNDVIYCYSQNSSNLLEDSQIIPYSELIKQLNELKKTLISKEKTIEHQTNEINKYTSIVEKLQASLDAKEKCLSLIHQLSEQQ